MKDFWRDIIAFLKAVDNSWAITWGIIYAGIVLSFAVDPSSKLVTFVKIGGIFLCLIYALLRYRKDKKLVVALSFTLLGDLALMLNGTSMVGVVLFCMVQFLHMTRLVDMNTKTFATYAAFLMVAIVIGNLLKAETMYIVGFIYATTLVGNIILSWNWFEQTKVTIAKLAVVGFVLFIACDLCVAVSYLSLTNVFPMVLYMPANYLAWVFYYPSQVFLANSSKTVIQ